MQPSSVQRRESSRRVGVEQRSYDIFAEMATVTLTLWKLFYIIAVSFAEHFVVSHHIHQMRRTMSGALVQRQLLRRQVLESSQCRIHACRARPIGRRRYATEEREDFKGQLYQSTNERVERERAEQARFAQIREARKAARGPPAWLVPFGRTLGTRWRMMVLVLTSEQCSPWAFWVAGT